MKKILLIGQTGVGKSTFINALLGRDSAPSSDYEACTEVVEYYAHKSRFGTVHLIDTPGLSEYDNESELKNLSVIKDYLSQNIVDIILYLTPLNETRFRQSEMLAIKNFNKHFGSNIWTKTWLVFTFASHVKKNKELAISTRTNQITEFIKKKTRKTNYPFVGFSNILVTDNIDFNWWKDESNKTSSYSKILNGKDSFEGNRINLKMSRRRKDLPPSA